jgi:hypothetical protein
VVVLVALHFAQFGMALFKFMPAVIFVLVRFIVDGMLEHELMLTIFILGIMNQLTFIHQAGQAVQVVQAERVV